MHLGAVSFGLLIGGGTVEEHWEEIESASDRYECTILDLFVLAYQRRYGGKEGLRLGIEASEKYLDGSAEPVQIVLEYIQHRDGQKSQWHNSHL